MRDSVNTQYRPMPAPDDGSRALAGTLGVLALLVGGLVAASYPVVTAAVVAGALSAWLAPRVAGRVRQFAATSPRTGTGTGARGRTQDLPRHT